MDVRAEEIVAGKAFSPEIEPRDPEHMHDYGQNPKPVLSFDLHHTLTPDMGFPLTSPPFPGVREFMNLMAARGCCLHVSTASLDDTDPDVHKARKAQIEDWAGRYGLPIAFVCSNAHAEVRVDDRGISVPPAPDWTAISAQAQAALLATFELDENGQYGKRSDLTPVRERRDTWPKLSSIPADRPRGFHSDDRHRRAPDTRPGLGHRPRTSGSGSGRRCGGPGLLRRRLPGPVLVRWLEPSPGRQRRRRGPVGRHHSVPPDVRHPLRPGGLEG